MGTGTLAICGWLLFATASGSSFAVDGSVEPAGAAVVWLYGATSPFSSSTLSDPDGRFHFAGILPGAYTLTVVTTAHGEWRQTVDVGPSVADTKGRVNVQVRIDETKSLADRRDIVSARELSIPQSAWKEYEKSEQRLSKHDVAAAIVHLQRATRIAPQFSVAWNSLGTIAYHAQQYAQAEQYFRKGLDANPDEYAPLVNLGGVLITLRQYREAWSFNTLAVSKQPNDALAHSQLGMACFALGKLDAAEAELKEAIRLDPRHFSNPQLVLAEVYVRERKPAAAADILGQFLELHPDFASAPKIRERIARLRAGR
ncbi:MAG: tetratricopeptide repeat protein [Bryobacteraceae bacterium]|jgi:Tfp pilus assembly protein PilF